MRFIQLEIYVSICLFVSICVCVPVALYYFGFPICIDTIEGPNTQTNERTDGLANRHIAILNNNTHRFARGQYNSNQGVAFMITFLLFIKYMYLKTELCQDVTLPEQ